jgi:hypothetical protein
MNQNFIRYSWGGILLDRENQRYHNQVLKNPRKHIQLQDNNRFFRLSVSQDSRKQKYIEN